MNTKLLQTSRFQYDPFQNPPNIELAHLHRKATLVGKKTPEKTNNGKTCPCCDKPIQKQPVSLLCSLNQLLFLGIGYPLYFSLLKYSSILLASIVLISGSLVKLYSIVFCQLNCVYFFGIPIQTENNLIKFPEPTFKNYIQITLLSIVVAAISYVVLKKIEHFNENSTLITEFSVIILNLPYGITEVELTQQLQEIFNETVISLTIGYDVNEYETAIKQKQQLFIKLNTASLMRRSSRYSNLDQQQLQRKIREFSNLIDRQDFIINNQYQKNDWKQSQIAFVTFQTTNIVHQIYSEHFKGNFFQKLMFYVFPKFELQMKIKNKTTLARIAPHPKEVMWENVGYLKKPSLLRSLLFISLMFLIIFIAYYFQFYLIEYLYRLNMQKWSQFDKQNLYYLSAFLLVIALVVSNTSIRFILQYFIKLKSFSGYTHFQANLTFYYSIIYIFNTCFLVYVIHESSQSKERTIFTIQVNLIMFINVFSRPILTLLNIDLWKKYFLRKHFQNMKEQQNPYTQKYVNQIMQGPKISNSNNYHYMIRVLFVGIWFCKVSPIPLLLSFFGLFLHYWITKYFLLRVYKQPEYISQQLAILVLKFFIFLPLFFCLGLLEYNHEIETSKNLFHFFYNFSQFGIVYYSLFLTLVNYFLFSWFKYKMIYQKHLHKNLVIENISEYFDETYYSENPTNKLGSYMKFSIPHNKKGGVFQLLNISGSETQQGKGKKSINKNSIKPNRNSYVYSPPKIKNKPLAIIRTQSSTFKPKNIPNNKQFQEQSFQKQYKTKNKNKSKLKRLQMKQSLQSGDS